MKIRGAGKVLACARPAPGRLVCYVWGTANLRTEHNSTDFLLGADLSDVKGSGV